MSEETLDDQQNYDGQNSFTNEGPSWVTDGYQELPNQLPNGGQVEEPNNKIAVIGKLQPITQSQRNNQA